MKNELNALRMGCVLQLNAARKNIENAYMLVYCDDAAELPIAIDVVNQSISDIEASLRDARDIRQLIINKLESLK